MSLIINAKENQFAYVENENGQREGSVSYTDSDKGEKSDNIELEDGYKFRLAPRPKKEKERMTLFVAGESGAGKSWFVREYAKRYKALFSKNPIYLISYLDRDETLDEYKEIIRLDAFQAEFLDECMELDLETEFSNALVIFDDIDSIVNNTGIFFYHNRYGIQYYSSYCTKSTYICVLFAGIIHLLKLKNVVL